MAHVINVELSDDVYAALSSRAERAGKSLEKFVTDRLLDATRLSERDDLVELAGFLHSDLTDIADRHDDYIGERLAQKLKPDASE